jgi:hypothetical protein
MDEVRSIIIALGVLIGGLLVLGWAYGDFRRPGGPTQQAGQGQKPIDS